RSRDPAIQSNRDQDDQDYREIKKGVDVQRVNQVLDVKAFLPEIKNFQNESEERNAEEHHGRQVAPESFHEKLRLGAVLADLVFDPFLHPYFERSLRSLLVGAELHVRSGFLL